MNIPVHDMVCGRLKEGGTTNNKNLIVSFYAFNSDANSISRKSENVIRMQAVAVYSNIIIIVST